MIYNGSLQLASSDRRLNFPAAIPTRDKRIKDKKLALHRVSMMAGSCRPVQAVKREVNVRHRNSTYEDISRYV